MLTNNGVSTERVKIDFYKGGRGCKINTDEKKQERSGSAKIQSGP